MLTCITTRRIVLTALFVSVVGVLCFCNKTLWGECGEGDQIAADPAFIQADRRDLTGLNKARDIYQAKKRWDEYVRNGEEGPRPPRVITETVTVIENSQVRHEEREVIEKPMEIREVIRDGKPVLLKRINVHVWLPVDWVEVDGIWSAPPTAVESSTE